MQTIKTELLTHLIDYVKGCDVSRTDWDDLHHEAFNNDYYIIGYHAASEWLDFHDVAAFQAIAYVIEQEDSHFGGSTLKPSDINSERIVNLLVYFIGYDVMTSCDLSDIKKADLLAELESEE